MGDKGDVYYCGWERRADGTYVGWVKKRASLRAEAATTGDLVQALGDAVGEYYDDQEAALQFDPELPAVEGNEDLFADGLVLIDWNAFFLYRPAAEVAFAGGRCDRCGGGLGERTSDRLLVDFVDAGADGAFSWASNDQTWRGMPGRLTVLSEAFLALLTDDERGRFEARPVDWANRGRRKFFEVVPRAYVPTVAVRGVEIEGWRCDVCGRRSHGHGPSLGYDVDVISRSDLSTPLPPCFFVGNPLDVRFCTTLGRWRQLCGARGSRKLVSGRVAVVDEARCEREPWLPTLDELAEFRRVHGPRVRYKRPVP